MSKAISINSIKYFTTMFRQFFALQYVINIFAAA